MKEVYWQFNFKIFNDNFNFCMFVLFIWKRMVMDMFGFCDVVIVGFVFFVF